jgi:MFS family permease
MKSAIADITPLKKRGTGYGIFNSAYGVAMFIGSAVMGLIYDFSIPLVIILSIIIEAVSVFVLILLRKEILLEA